MTSWTDEDEVAAGLVHARAQARLVSRSVALVGFMGVGKTSIGRELARVADRRFVDTDVMVEEMAGRSVPELFAESEERFRQLEEDAVHRALDGPPGVVALGGGAFERPSNVQRLRAHALVIHIHVPWSVLRGALPELRDGRPLIAGRSVGEIHDLFLARSDAYRRAHIRFSFQRTGVGDAVDAISRVLRAYRSERPVP